MDKQVAEWNCLYTYQKGHMIWHEDIVHYCYRDFSLNDEPGFESKVWTTDKRLVS